MKRIESVGRHEVPSTTGSNPAPGTPLESTARSRKYERFENYLKEVKLNALATIHSKLRIIGDYRKG